MANSQVTQIKQELVEFEKDSKKHQQNTTQASKEIEKLIAAVQATLAGSDVKIDVEVIEALQQVNSLAKKSVQLDEAAIKASEQLRKKL